MARPVLASIVKSTFQAEGVSLRDADGSASGLKEELAEAGFQPGESVVIVSGELLARVVEQLKEDYVGDGLHLAALLQVTR